ncbi:MULTISPECIES: hypothetical protein [Novosphingobium]|uniref:hypothetical protein n=1 Tax=Novosphingobium TaxID=165696 RepID=UPI001CD54C98|nr:hypothetical protein [Novosphingobium percolationis]MCH7628808.1 hypothetical protein [Pseudomonadota bacterium]
MRALTQCWFTRLHRPERRIEHDDDGSHLSQCRYCARRIVSWDRDSWYLADGFNVSRLAETVGARSLTLVDVTEEMVLHRFSVSHLNDEEAITAFKRQVAERFGLDEPGSPLRLLDSAGHAPGPPARNRRVRPAAPDNPQSA